jgi:hypothetical protein
LTGKRAGPRDPGCDVSLMWLRLGASALGALSMKLLFPLRLAAPVETGAYASVGRLTSGLSDAVRLLFVGQADALVENERGGA